MSVRGVDELVSSLLYEGYALYPYTPGAAKNATPTPFGIVYPNDYAETQPAAFSMLRLECVLRGGPEAKLTGTVRFLQAAGERHKGVERRLGPGIATLAELAREPLELDYEFDPEDSDGRASADRAGADVAQSCSAPSSLASSSASTTTPRSGGPRPTSPPAPRACAAACSPRTRCWRWRDGEFVSPLERDGEEGEAVEASEAVNTFPVLVGDGDQAVLGAAIMLPDHPELAPESLGNLFDNTEIEEALLLHVQTLSDSEREGIAEQDPAVREMIERADNVSNDEMMSLHGRLTYKEPDGDEDGEVTNGTQLVPPAGIDVTPGEQELELGPKSVRFGDKVVLRPGPRATSSTRSCTAAPRRSSASTRATTSASTSGSRSTTTPARTCCATRAATCSSSPTRWRFPRDARTKSTSDTAVRGADHARAGGAPGGREGARLPHGQADPGRGGRQRLARRRRVRRRGDQRPREA